MPPISRHSSRTEPPRGVWPGVRGGGAHPTHTLKSTARTRRDPRAPPPATGAAAPHATAAPAPARGASARGASAALTAATVAGVATSMRPRPSTSSTVVARARRAAAQRAAAAAAAAAEMLEYSRGSLPPLRLRETPTDGRVSALRAHASRCSSGQEKGRKCGKCLQGGVCRQREAVKVAVGRAATHLCDGLVR